MGFSVEEVAGEAPEPKSQLKVNAPPVDPVLVKSTSSPVHSGAVDAKPADGVLPMTMTVELLCVQLRSLMVNVTVFEPPEA